MAWSVSPGSVFLVAIQVEALDRHRLLSDITKVLADEKVNILSASVTTSRDRVAISRFTFEMGDPKHLGHVLQAVRNVEGVYDVYRVTSAELSGQLHSRAVVRGGELGGRLRDQARAGRAIDRIGPSPLQRGHWIGPPGSPRTTNRAQAPTRSAASACWAGVERGLPGHQVEQVGHLGAVRSPRRSGHRAAARRTAPGRTGR